MSANALIAMYYHVLTVEKTFMGTPTLDTHRVYLKQRNTKGHYLKARRALKPKGSKSKKLGSGKCVSVPPSICSSTPSSSVKSMHFSSTATSHARRSRLKTSPRQGMAFAVNFLRYRLLFSTIHSRLRLKSAGQLNRFWGLFDPEVDEPSLPGSNTETSTPSAEDSSVDASTAAAKADDPSIELASTSPLEAQDEEVNSATKEKSENIVSLPTSIPSFYIDLGDGQAQKPVAKHMTPTFFAKAAMEEGATVVVEPASKPNPKPKKGKRSQKEALPSIVKEIASSFAHLESLQAVEEATPVDKKKKKKDRKSSKKKKRRLRGSTEGGKDGTSDGEPGAKRSKGIQSERKKKAAVVLQHKAGDKEAKKKAKQEKRRLRKEKENAAKAYRRPKLIGVSKYDKNKAKKRAAAADAAAPQ
eukprot:m.79702 g.79702  ORF g.79702 m.79702 type:complete len:415 (+) comp14525_c0_seq1:123-1367(+)